MAQHIETDLRAKQTTTRFMMKCMKVVMVTIETINKIRAFVKSYQVASAKARQVTKMVKMMQLISPHSLRRRKRRESSSCGTKQGVTTTNFDFKPDCKRWLSPT